MSKLFLYIAASLDGYIADKDGSVDWLDTSTDVGYSDFISSIDALVMGRKTFDQILSFCDWPYAGKTCFVFSSHDLDNPPEGVTRVQGPIDQVYSGISKKINGNIWLVGGPKIASAFREHHLIDEYHIYLQPIWLGEGIPLFKTPLSRERVTPVSTRMLDGNMIELIYKKSA